MENTKRRHHSPEGLVAALAAAIGPHLPSAGTPPARLAVAFSGGADSALLLHVAHLLAQREGYVLFAFHIHHGLQERADQWQQHCAAVAQALGVRYDSRRIHVDRKSTDGSLEAAARQARYSALSDLCVEHSIDVVATGHHADDQAETVLLNLMRGCGVAGIAGIAGYRTLAHATLVRPFLTIAKDTLQFCERGLGIVAVADPSNDDQRFKRNAVRHALLPLIRAHAPSVVAHLTDTARHARDAQTLLDELGAMDLAHSTAAGAGPSLSHLRTLSRERAANALRWWFRTRGSNAPSASSLDQVLHQLFNTESTSRLSVPCAGGELHVASDELVFTRAFILPKAPVELTWDGLSAFIDVPQWQGRLHLIASDAGIAASALTDAPLSIRARAGRERLRVSPNRPTRTLKNLYQERGIAAWQRPRMPLLFREETLVFAAGLGMELEATQRAAPTGEARIRLEWSLIDGFSQPFPRHDR